MVSYSKAAMEQAMKVQEVFLRAMAKKTTVVARSFCCENLGPIRSNSSS